MRRAHAGPAGHPVLPAFGAVPARADEDLATYQACAERSRAAAAACSLDDLLPDPSPRPTSLRWVYQHMIEEYARHNGHADLLRERIDGSRGT
jgi:hypothetical protein